MYVRCLKYISLPDQSHMSNGIAEMTCCCAIPAHHVIAMDDIKWVQVPPFNRTSSFHSPVLHM